MRNSGKWTESRYHSFVKGALRSASNRWPPKYEVRKEAWVSRGRYRCAGYRKKAHIVPATIRNPSGTGRGVANVFVDHILPVVDPALGFVNWDVLIERLFCEKGGLQVLCKECHDLKTTEERVQRKKKNG